MNREPLTLRQIVTLLKGCLDAGADPDLPVGVHIGDDTALVNTVSVTDEDSIDVWVGATEGEP